MLGHLARLSSENSLKTVPRALQNAAQSCALSTVSTRVLSLSCLRTVQYTSSSVLKSQSRSVFSLVKRSAINQTPEHVRSMLPCFSVICRGLKTRKSAAKRFIKTGTGELKYGHAGKRHNTSKKTKTRQRRLNQLVRFMPSNISPQYSTVFYSICCFPHVFPSISSHNIFYIRAHWQEPMRRIWKSWLAINWTVTCSKSWIIEWSKSL